MPGFDRTGPMGAGPMTGGGRGYCGRRTGNMPYYGRGAGRGRGFGRSAAYGRGFGFGRGYGAAAPGYYPMAAGNELGLLRNEADYLKNELEAIQRRIDDLESTSSSE